MGIEGENEPNIDISETVNNNTEEVSSDVIGYAVCLGWIVVMRLPSTVYLERGCQYRRYLRAWMRRGTYTELNSTHVDKNRCRRRRVMKRAEEARPINEVTFSEREDAEKLKGEQIEQRGDRTMDSVLYRF